MSAVERLLHAYVATLPLTNVDLAVASGWKVVTPADLAFVALLGALAADRRWLRRPRPATAGPLLAVPLALLLASAASPEPARAVPDLARVCYSMAVLGLFSHLRGDGPLLARLGRTWVLAAGLVSGLGLLAWAGVWLGLPPSRLASADSIQLWGVPRAASTLQTNALPLYLQASLALALPLLAAGTNAGERRLAQASLLSMAAVAPLTFSRGLAGLATSLAVMAAVSRGRLDRLWRARWALSLLAALLIAVATATTAWLGIFVSSSGSVTLSSLPGGYAVHQGAAWSMWRSRPLLGVGPGRYGLELAAHSEARLRHATFVSAVAEEDPHSTWLGWAAEGGLVTLLAWVVLYSWILSRVLAGPDPWTARLVAAALAGILLNGFHVEISHLKFLWAFAGLALARGWSDPPSRAGVAA